MTISFTAKARPDNSSLVITIPYPLVQSKGLEAGEYYDFDIKLEQETNKSETNKLNQD